VQIFRSIVCILFFLSSPSLVAGKFITTADQLEASGVNFTWSDVRTKTVKIFLEYQDPDGNWRRASLGSGFLISADGLFLTAYHVMKFCLKNDKANDGLSVNLDCSTAQSPRYKALAGEREFDIQIISHLSETDSTRGKEIHTPDEIIKQRDFVVGRLKSATPAQFDYWQLRDFDETAIDLSQARADFELMPLMPPKRVFIAGFAKDGDFVISEGFLNLTEKNRRGYFAADYKVYTATYLQSLGVAADTRWGMGVQNHMSGGPVVDSAGFVVGVVVNGNRNTAGILSIENVLSTFFSRTGGTEEHPAVLLNPAKTPLYLKGLR
jgi:Trypsin-like peptidase domain